MLKPSDLQHLIPLGQGPGTRVFRAQDPEGHALLLKTFSLADAPDWKAQELFEREGQILQHLNHPHLPQLLAYGVEDGVSYLIYPFIAGESLQHKLADGWRPTQAEALELIRQLLKTLIWLHDRQPPVVHRDVKPSNLILTAENQLYLIDFGSVLQHLKPQGGSTVAGTFGYMAPEQLSGRALPASDLYAVGATLIHLLSGKAPAELPQERLWFKFEDHVQLSAPLRNWLKSLIHPVLEERCQSAQAALTKLEKAQFAPALPTTAMPTDLALFQQWPVPVPDTGQTSIAIERVPQGISILLPRRKSKKAIQQMASLPFGLATLLFLSRFLETNIPLEWMTHFVSPAIALLIAAELTLYYRHHRLSNRQTHLTLGDDTLIIAFSEKSELLTLPWAQITGIQATAKQEGVKLKYTDPKTGKPKHLMLGNTLESDEQFWLFGLLREQQRNQSAERLKIKKEGKDEG